MKFNNIIDISRRIYPGMVLWPGDAGVQINRQASIKSGDICNLSSINMGLHTGTHIDAPLHFIDEGEDVSSRNLSRFMGFAKVFELNVKECITADDIKSLSIDEDDIVLFKTVNGLIPEEADFVKYYVYIDASAAKWLIDKKVKTVGIDYLSVDNFYLEDSPVHRIFLSQGVGIIEGLQLKDVKEGRYFLSCLPLRIDGVDGCPVRAVLVEIEE